MPKVEPIRPADVVSKKKEIMPDHVIEAFNHFIALNWNGKSSTFKLKEVLERIIEAECRETGEDIYQKVRTKVLDNKWLDVEEIYRAENWSVYFDRPGYNETYDATYEFKMAVDQPVTR